MSVKITERSAKITISGSETLEIVPAYRVIAIYGENIQASMIEGFDNNTAQGVYDTSEHGVDLIVAEQPIKTLYLKGTGDVKIRCGVDPAEVPFKSAGKGGGSGDGVHFKGSTSTALTDGATTNPITIDGSSYTAVMGDMVIYSNKEFLFDGTSWHEMGDLSDTVGRKYYVNGVAKGEIFNDYTNNVASGSSSHAEGSHCAATKQHAHAEGSSTNALGDYSHAEGITTTASGNSAHAEGALCSASGYAAHAEGESTIASGEGSHAEGINTRASGTASHVSGKYNDFQTGDLFEIGNGTSSNARSNIVEVSSTYLNVNGDIQQSGAPIRATTMPTITASMVGAIVQYVGTTDSNYKQGWDYVAVSDGATPPVYSWSPLMDTTPTNGSANAVTSGGIANLIRKGSTTNAVRMGSSTSSGTYTLSQGDGSTASGYAACAINNGKASGNYTFAQGTGTTASNTNMAAFGKYNSVVSGDLFEIGNGASSSDKSNILEVSPTALNVNGAIKANGVAYITPYTTMPTVTAAMVGQIAQYMGVTDSNYTRGWFYEAVSDGESDPTYSWEVINFPKVPGGGDALTATQNGVYVPTSAYGYSSVTVNVPFYARTDATLADVSTVEGDEMHIEPTAGTNYYPRLFLMSTPYPNPEQEAPTDRGKYFAPTDVNYAVTAYIDIIDKATGQSVTGYPQIVNTSAAYSNFGINSGGYIRLKGWKVTTSGNHLKVSVTTTRWNTTYSNPIDDTYNTQSDVETWLSAYTTPPYVIKDDRWTVIESGSCGTNATYVLYRNGTLVISGTGVVTNGGWDSTKVVDVLVGEGITLLSAELFDGHTNMRSINIPESISIITTYLFRSCTSLTTLTLPDTITNINNRAFLSSGLTVLTVLATTPPTLGNKGPSFGTATIYVPAASVDAYKTAWSSYANKIQAIPSGD